MTSLEPSRETSSTSIYQQLSQYPFDTDPEYQAGLAAILGHPGTPATSEELADKSELVVQAQCFYFSRKFNMSVDPAAYYSWQRSTDLTQTDAQTESSSAEAPPSTSSSNARPPSQPASSTSGPEPPYPTSFAAIVDLITRNLPVPGIEEIPTTVLEPGSSKVDNTPRRKKPWEKDAETTVPSTAEAAGSDLDTRPKDGPQEITAGTEEAAPIDVNGHKETGEGVVKILQPNAIPDSGLLSKD